MFRSLYSRLALALFAVLLLVGILFGGTSWYLAKQHTELVVQQFNRDLATHLIQERRLVDQGEINYALLKSTFEEYMAINPSIEIYLLDAGGRIVSHSAPADKVIRDRIALAPIREFLNQTHYTPVLGTDPRSHLRQKPFSVAPVNTSTGMFGYLYVVLRGENYDAVAQAYERNYLLRFGLQMLALSLAIGLLAGLLMLWLVTRPLRQLTESMDRFQTNPANDGDAISRRGGDEVARLQRAFEAMALRIRHQIRRLESNDRKRRDLVANISHDLRTPLSAVLGYLEALKERSDQISPEEYNDYLSTALRNAERVSAMVDELFELAKLEAGAAKPNLEAFSLDDLVQDVMHQHALSVAARGIELSVAKAESLPLVRGDIAMVQRVLDNLIGNAVHHLKHNGRIVANLATEPDRVRVDIWDNGEPLDPADASRIFERFARGSDRDERKRGALAGAGLGLAIAQQIMAIHGSRIEITQGKEDGKAFSFSLGVAG